MYRKNGEARASLPRIAVRRHRLARGVISGGVIAAAALAFAPLASATPATLSQTVNLPAHVHGSASVDFCNNRTSQVTINGGVDIGGVSVQLKFDGGGTHDVTTPPDVAAPLSITPTSQNYGFKGGPMGPGGNAWMWLGFVQPGTSTLLPGTDLIPLGRCVQGLDPVGFDKWFTLPTSAGLLAQALSCSNKGNAINVTGSEGGGNIQGMLFFDNQRWLDPTKHYMEMPVSASFDLANIPPVQKGGQVNSTTGNPDVYGRFYLSDTVGKALPADQQPGWAYLNRCVKMG